MLVVGNGSLQQHFLVGAHQVVAVGAGHKLFGRRLRVDMDDVNPAFQILEI